MTLRQLLFRSLKFHRRGNLAVLLGVAVGAAVITGALLVGDSLRGSLRERALRQVGWVETALLSRRFVNERLLTLPQEKKDERVVPAIVMPCTVESNRGGRQTSVRDVTLIGLGEIPAHTRPLTTGPKDTPLSFPFALPKWLAFLQDPVPIRVGEIVGDFESVPEGSAILSAALSRELGIVADTELMLRWPKPDSVPRESLLGRRDAGSSISEHKVPVFGSYADNQLGSTFSLLPTLREPRTVFVSLNFLQNALGMPGKANAFFAYGISQSDLNRWLSQGLTLSDWGVIVGTPKSRTDALLAALDRNKDGALQPNEWRGRLAQAVVDAADVDHNRTLTRQELEAYFENRGYVSLESRQMVIEPVIERAAVNFAETAGLIASPTLVYLANGLSDGHETIPYSIIAAMDPTALPTRAGAPVWSLKDDEILLADWKDSPLTAKVGEKITVTYFEPELEGRIKESWATFTLRGKVPMTGLAADPDLAPEFPGITDKLDIKEWDPPFPYDNKLIQPRDDEYWNRYRTTPKAYITLAAGRKLFASRFGQATSVRLSTPDHKTPDNGWVQFFEAQLPAKLDPAAGGFVFEDVRARALAASTGGQDFGMLFLGFSFFLIAAALMLVGLLVRLNIDRRASEFGLLVATGYSLKVVRRLIVREGMILGILGGFIGLFLAGIYAGLMLRLLGSLWPDGSVGSFLHLHVSGLSLLIGFVGTLVAVWLTLRWAVRSLNRVAPSALLAGTVSQQTETIVKRPKRAIIIAIVALIAAVALLIGGQFAHEAEARAGTFFSGGAALLTAILAGGWAWLRRPERQGVGPGPLAIAKLGARNTSRNPTRSLLTAAVLASAAFLLVAVESFRRSPEADFLKSTGGSGGFSLLAQTDLPLYQDPSAPEGRAEILDALEKRWLEQSLSPQQVQQKLTDAKSALDSATIIPLRRQAGDDASCLNLYQPGRPRIVGVPPALIARGGFQFSGSEGSKENPWRLLDAIHDDGTIPAIGEANTVQWMLKSSLGGTIAVRDEQGREVKLRIVALLQDSVFQGELLVADSAFHKHFPRQEGFSELLIDSNGHEDAVRELFSVAYAQRGIAISNAKDKLQGYLQVENTYLSTFQILGGFGLLLGTLGLAVVLLRNVWERRREFALLRAVGYRRRDLGGLVLAENAALVLFGLCAGVGSALIAVAPQATAGGTPWARLAGLLALVVVAGLAAGLLGLRATVRAPLVAGLRNE